MAEIICQELKQEKKKTNVALKNLKINVSLEVEQPDSGPTLVCFSGQNKNDYRFI